MKADDSASYREGDIRFVTADEALAFFIQLGFGSATSKTKIDKAIHAIRERASPIRLRSDSNSDRIAALARILGSILSRGEGSGLFFSTDFGWSAAQNDLILSAMRKQLGATESMIETPAFFFSAACEEAVIASLALSLYFNHDVVILRPDHLAVAHVDNDKFVDIYVESQEARESIQGELAPLISALAI